MTFRADPRVDAYIDALPDWQQRICRVPDGDMFNVSLGGGSASLLFVTDPSVAGHHVAFAVTEAQFGAIVDRLRSRNIAFGNEPENPANGETSDPLGGKGRVYFLDPNGHFFEVTTG